MFVIKHLESRAYFHNKGRIILFETQQEAQNFANLFAQYSTDRLMREGRMTEIIGVSMYMSGCQIIQPNFDIEKVKCGTVLARELFEQMGRR